MIAAGLWEVLCTNSTEELCSVQLEGLFGSTSGELSDTHLNS